VLGLVSSVSSQETGLEESL